MCIIYLMQLLFPQDYPSSAPPVFEIRYSDEKKTQCKYQLLIYCAIYMCREAPFIDDGQLQQISDSLSRIHRYVRIAS